MKKVIKIIIILLLCSTSVLGQKVSSSDSIEVIKTLEAFFVAVKSDDMETLINISTNKIYCLICSDAVDLSKSPYIFDKKVFLTNYLPKIKNSELFQRATKSVELILVKEDSGKLISQHFGRFTKKMNLLLGMKVRSLEFT